MKCKFFLLFISSVFLLPAIFSSCKDDDTETEDLNQDDPRIRQVTFLDMSSTVFVVNDVQSIIYNYDSLSYGTKITYLKPYFYGYTSTPKVEYNQDGEWIEFSNGEALDFTKPLQIRSTSYDGKYSKEYTFDMRVHEFDVQSFTWQKVSDLVLPEQVTTQFSCMYNGDYLWFYTSGSESFLYRSTDGVNWEKTNISLSDLDWSTAVLVNSNLYVQTTAGSIYLFSMDNLSFSLLQSSVSIERLLFSINDILWAIGDNEGKRALFYFDQAAGEFIYKSTLPDNFPTLNIKTFVASSGYTVLGYLYATDGEYGTIWSVDSSGRTYQLVKADGSIPYLLNPMTFAYNKTLGIIGGVMKDGTYSLKCFSSSNSGSSWIYDWHKDLTIGSLSNSGLFVTSMEGELLLIGGNTETSAFPYVLKGILNQITADNMNYNRN